MTYHVPVMSDEVVEGLGIEKGKLYVDATLGGGGHTKAILEHGGRVIAIDQDEEALEEAKTIPELGKELTLIQGNFKNIEELIRKTTDEEISGIVFDLGVSSHQLDTKERGFSYRFLDAPLDLRFHQKKGVSAKDIIAYESEKELTDIFETLGEEECAGRIAHALVRIRSVKPILTAGDLVSVIRKETGDSDWKGVASRIFQALRIEVNDEISALKNGLEGASRLLGKNGRLCVISFHSLEDRIVKKFMQDDGRWKEIIKRPIRPSDEERIKNSRSRSAKLRIAEKVCV